MGFFSKLFKGPEIDMEKSRANAGKMRELFDQAVENGDDYRLIFGYTEDVSRFNYGFVHGSKTKIGNLIVETLYLQQPRIIAYVQKLRKDPALSWRDAVKQFLHACCYGEKNGIAVLTVEEQQLIFKRLSEESYRTFRAKQRRLFGQILEGFGIKADAARISLFTNLSLTVMVVRRAIPDTLPLFVPEVADETVDFQINAIVDALEAWKDQDSLS